MYSLWTLIIGVIFILLGMSPIHGLESPILESPIHGGAKDTLQLAEYVAPIPDTPFSDKLASGDLTDTYPLYPYIYKGKPQPPGVKYVKHDAVKTYHWGQRKLLLSEIDFLHSIPVTPCTVVYAGAADGRHMPILVAMFPHVEFHLYDPRPFYKGINGHRNILINPFYDNLKSDKYGWFTDDVAKWYADKPNIYFISDIRTLPTEEEIELNQRQQESWVRIMKCMSMLKFKCPYPKVGAPKTYHYLAGRVRLQCWAPVASAETRLIVNDSDYDWNIVKWERNLAWYNQVMRGHDFSESPIRDYIPKFVGDDTVRKFWSRYVPDKIQLGWDFIYELQILAGSHSVDADMLHGIVSSINKVLISKGAHFHNYL